MKTIRLEELHERESRMTEEERKEQREKRRIAAEVFLKGMSKWKKN